MNANQDRDLSRLYRAGAREEPPRRLDEAVLDEAARHATERSPARHRTPITINLQTPLALAAVLVLAVSLALVVDHESASLSEADTQAPAQRAPASQRPDRGPPAADLAPDAQPQRDTRAPAPKPMPAARAPASTQGMATPSQVPDGAGAGSSGIAQEDTFARNKAMRGLAPGTGVPATGALSAPAEAAGERFGRARDAALPERESVVDPPAPARSEAAESATRPERSSASGPNSERGRLQARRPATTTAPSRKAEAAATEAAPAAPPAARSAPAAAPPDVTPEQLLQEIEQLKQVGRIEEAQERIAAFRSRYPDYPLPPSLQ